MNSSAPTREVRGRTFAQSVMGFFCYFGLTLPYVKHTHGTGSLQPRQRYLFVSNHVSLLDTILLGGIFWRCAALPILVLGDKTVWQSSWIRRTLSRPIGFLLERGKLNTSRIQELKAFGRAKDRYNLIVFPEGTRGNGIDVGACQRGIYYIAQEARLPIIPIFIENMQQVSTKNGHFHPISGLRKVEVHFGKTIDPDSLLAQPPEEFTRSIQRSIIGLRPTRAAAHLNPALPRA